jgi:hypothetical protein
VDQAPAARVARDQADRAAQADRVGLVIRVTPGDTNRVVATADTAATARADTIPVDPEVTTLGDMTRERPRVRSQADLAMPGDTIPEGRAPLGRMPVRRDRVPVRRPLTGEPPLRMRALLHPTQTEHRIQAEHQTPARATPRRK